LQAAEISNGRTVSQAMPYCHPQANPHEGSMKRQMYMVNAPLIGYMTDISASACIMRYLGIVRMSSRGGCSIRASLHHEAYYEPISLFVVSEDWNVQHSPMIMKPSSTEAGPPVVKAPPEPTKRPAPIAPPLGQVSKSHCTALYDERRDFN
jgi:hypothetical protein